MILADTSGLLSLYNRREPTHPSVAEAVAQEQGPFVVSPYVIAELDYLVSTRLGADAEQRVLADRLGIDRVLTLHRRHFEAVRTPSGRALAIVP
ncbi:MAG: PIN domain-containing protein [Actinomycetota bacterium]